MTQSVPTGPASPDKPQSSAWTLKPGRNPYRRNAFSILDVDPDAGMQEFLRQCRRLGQLLEGKPEVEVRGERVTEADLARAEQLVTEHERFAAERLLAHTVHRLEDPALEEALRAIDAIEFPAPETLLPLPISDPSFLVGLLPESAAQARDAVEPDLDRLSEFLRPRRNDERGV